VGGLTGRHWWVAASGKKKCRPAWTLGWPKPVLTPGWFAAQYGHRGLGGVSFLPEKSAKWHSILKVVFSWKFSA